ncbi:TPA: hypothetical protein KP562_003190 [Clostridioides difficile]|nr:hypothetical protein [Clostridioides difficile]HBF8833678.1 hypothetical protein [Clostridioides difficile]HBG3258947.1 hypothetical protein [Clostridioides difficile]
MNKVIENKTKKLIETKGSSTNEFLSKKIDSDDLIREIKKMTYEERKNMYYMIRGINLMNDSDITAI